jgi:hypothetical protein
MAKKSTITDLSESDNKLLQKYLALFQLAWKECREYFDRANKDIALFEQEPDFESATLSDITLGEAKKFVDQILPPIWFQMMGSDNPFEFIPGGKGVSYEKARNVRDWVLYNMMTNMNLKTEGYLTIKDAVKLGKGYGIIEPKLITPPMSDEKTVFTEDEQVSTHTMEIGEPVMVAGYSYIPFGQVIPTPDGKNPDEVSCTFVLRFRSEDVFRKMLDKKLNPDTPFSGNAEEIIQYARSNSMDGYVRTSRQVAAQIANRQRTVADMMNNQNADDTPVSIPILECYARDEHIWFACDRFPIYHKKSKFQTLRSPVVVATFDPDGDNWFTPGIIRPRASMIKGVETFNNAVMDLVTQFLHPHQVINRDALVRAGESPDLQPYGKTEITGAYKTGEVVSFITPPVLPPFLLEIGSRLEEFDTASVGQPKSLHGQGTAGLVRGGSGAMESLQQSTSGREKLTTQHFENGWYASVVEQSLILCQMLAHDKELLPKLQYNPATGKNEFGFTEITQDDIRQVYKLQLSFTDKMQNQLAEIQRSSMIYDRAVQNRFVNPKEAFALLVGNTRQFNQLTQGVNPEENLAAMQAQAGKQPAEGGEGAAGAPPEMTIPGGAGMAPGGLAM